MTSQARTAPIAESLIAVVIALGGILLYTRSLDYVPPYLIHDEAQGALQAHSIATTGHDLSGRLLPLYFTEPEFPPGRDPALIYWTALGLTMLPFSEAGARTPTALIAVLDIVLMFFAARALFKSTSAGVIAAMMLALAPVHFIRGRLLLSPLYSIPFVLAWLWALARFEETPTVRRFTAACVWLALGMYSYLAAVVMMPLYLLLSLAVAARSLRWRAVAVAGAVMIVCLVPMAAWYVTHPERNSQIVSAYQLNPGVSLIGHYAHLYWSFFDPSYLFMSGDSSLVNSTRTAGLFPFAFAVLLPIGLITLIRSRRPLNLVLAAGLVAAPAVSIISGAIEMNRVMFAIPFTILVATYASIVLWSMNSVAPKAMAAVLVASVVFQFAAFYGDYMSDRYRMSSATWFSGSVREALRELISRSGESPVYISQEIEWVHRMWRFYTIEAGRMDLLSRTTYVREVPATVAPKATLLCREDSAYCNSLSASGLWQRVIVVPSIDGSHRFVILERLAAGNQSR